MTTYSDFLTALANQESDGDPAAYNSLGYIGLYQLGAATLVEAGFIEELSTNTTGTTQNYAQYVWTGKDGINSADDFLGNVTDADSAAGLTESEVEARADTAQQDAITSSLAVKFGQLQKVWQYVGQVINGNLVTLSGELGAAHLGGAGGVSHFFASGETYNPSDGSKTISDYMNQFAGYDTPFTITINSPEVVIGSAGDDTLTAFSYGSDVLVGDGGNDTFDLSASTNNIADIITWLGTINDQITGYQAGDRVIIDGTLIGDATQTSDGGSYTSGSLTYTPDVNDLEITTSNGSTIDIQTSIVETTGDYIRYGGPGGIVLHNYDSSSGAGDEDGSGASIDYSGGSETGVDTLAPYLGYLNSAFPDGGTISDGSWTAFLSSYFNQSERVDPIVLDLSGDNSGVQLTSLADSSAYFDLYGTDYAVHTGWVGPTTGILVDTTDPTSINDLFGSSTTNGFAALQALDVYDTGVINSSDPGFADLYVWEDANGNGVADSGEVQSLSSLGIVSISLETTPVNEVVNGDLIGEVATFTYADDTTGQVAEAFFDNSQLDSTYTGSYTLNPETLALPNLRGYGTVPDLYIAMSLDSTLLGMVQNLANDSLADAATFDQQVTDIIYRWAGVDGVDPTSRGDYVNGQDLGALEQFLGQTFDQGGSSTPNSEYVQSDTLAWNELFASVKERLLAQGPLASLLSGVSYNYDTDSLTGTTDFSALVSAIGANIPSDNATAVQYLANLGQFMGQLASDLGVSASTYDSTLQSYFEAAGAPLTLTAVDNLHYPAPIYSSIGGSETAMFSADDTGAIIAGESGITNILQASGDISQSIISDVPTMWASNVTLTVDEFNSFDTILTYTGSSSGSGGALYAATAGTYDLASKSTAQFNMYAESNDGTTLIGNDADGESLYASSSGNDTLEAGNGSSDNLYAGGGVDTLVGGSGNDTFGVSGTVATGTSIEGGTGANVLEAIGGSADISGATISGIQTLQANYITLTADQLDGFSSVEGYEGSGTLYAATAGTYDLEGLTTDDFAMYANNNDGTTLIGNDANGEVLYASTSGNDTLEAGNGSGDYLIAGGGIDTLIGGGGSTTFTFSGTPVTGTVVEGGSGANTLAYSGDITGATISGVQTLSTSNITLTADQLAGFSSVEGYFGSGTLYAATAGTYDLEGLTTDDFTMHAGNNDGTTLIGNDANNEVLYASTSGNDTLEAGNGSGDYLIAGGGIDTLIGGGGSTTFTFSGTPVTGTVVEGGSGANTLAYSGDITGATISGVQTLSTSSITLTADQLDGFSSVEGYFGSGTLYAATAGTYDLAGKTTDDFTLHANSNDGTTLIGNDANGEVLYASTSGNDTLEAGNGSGDYLIAGGGIDTLIGGGGSTTFTFSGTPVTGTVVEGGSGTNTLAYNGDISAATISGVQTLQANYITLTADQLDGFSSVESYYGSGTLYAATAGTYDLEGLTTDNFTMYANNNDGTTLIGNDANSEVLYASTSGDDTLEAGNGSGDYLIAGGGIDTLIGGGGSTTFALSYTPVAGTTIEGGSGANTLAYSGDISAASISGVQTLETSSITLTADQLDGFSSVEGYGGSGTLYAATAGTYDLAGLTTDDFAMHANSNDGTTLIGNDANGEALYASTSGNDTLEAGNGNYDALIAGGGNDTLIAGAGNNTLDGGSGYDAYQFGASFGQDTINNNGGSAANGEIDFLSGSGISDENLWFQQSGNDLQIDLLGTSSQITVAGWFSSAGAQVTSINADGLAIDSQIATLVSAMATYSAANSGFNPTTATSMPTDTTLQTAIAASWHS